MSTYFGRDMAEDMNGFVITGLIAHAYFYRTNTINTCNLSTKNPSFESFAFLVELHICVKSTSIFHQGWNF